MANGKAGKAGAARGGGGGFSLGVLPWAATLGVLEARVASRPPAFPALLPGDRVRVLTATSAHHRVVYALWAPPASKDGTVLVYLHGLGQQLAEQPLDFVREMSARYGFGVLALEYPGSGLAHGYAKSERAIYQDTERMLDKLRRQGLLARKRRLVLVGYSLGTGVAAEMALRGWGARMVLVAPYTSVPEAAGALAGRSSLAPLGRLVSPLARVLVADRFDTAAKAPRISIPVLIIHGAEDQVVPADMGAALAKRFPSALIELVPGADHFLFKPPHAAATLSAIAAFAAPAGPTPTGPG
jgi:uncharacterized protein